MTAQTAAEINDMMTAAFARIGSSQADADIERAMCAILLDGLPFGTQPAEMRRPNSTIYFQPYLEALCVIRTLVELGLGDVIANVSRQVPPAPDVRVDFTQGGAAFVEHSMVMDERAFEVVYVALESANFRFRELAAADARVTTLLESGILFIRLDVIPISQGIDVEGLAQEALRVAGTITDRDPFKINDAKLPILSAAGAWANYKRCKAKTWFPLYPAEPQPDRPVVFAPTLRAVLEGKIAKAAGYDPTCRPLWLLLSVSGGFAYRCDVEGAVRALVRDIGIGSFDRLVVQCPRRSPLVFS